MLQKCMITVDTSQVQYLLGHLGGYDQPVLECQDQLADSLKQVYYLLPFKIISILYFIH